MERYGRVAGKRTRRDGRQTQPLAKDSQRVAVEERLASGIIGMLARGIGFDKRYSPFNQRFHRRSGDPRFPARASRLFGDIVYEPWWLIGATKGGQLYMPQGRGIRELAWTISYNAGMAVWTANSSKRKNSDRARPKGKEFRTNLNPRDA